MPEDAPVTRTLAPSTCMAATVSDARVMFFGMMSGHVCGGGGRAREHRRGDRRERGGRRPRRDGHRPRCRSGRGHRGRDRGGLGCGGRGRERDHVDLVAEPDRRDGGRRGVGERGRAWLDPARAVHHAAREQPGHRRPAGHQRAPLRGGAAHRRRHRRPEPRAWCSWSAATTSAVAAACRCSTSWAGHVPRRPGGRRHHHEAGQQPAGLRLHVGVVRVAVARRQGRHRPAHGGGGDPHGRRHQLLHRPRRGGHQRPRQAGRVHARAGGQGRRPHQRDRRRPPASPRRSRRPRARCSTTPSPAAWATTTGPTSCSPPRRGPASTCTCPRRPRPDVPRVAIEDGYFTIPDDPAEPPAPAGQPVPELRRGLLPAAARVREVPPRGHR